MFSNIYYFVFLFVSSVVEPEVYEVTISNLRPNREYNIIVFPRSTTSIGVPSEIKSGITEQAGKYLVTSNLDNTNFIGEIKLNRKFKEIKLKLHIAAHIINTHM